MTLPEFLALRLAEDERMAKAVAGSGHWSPYIEGGDDGWAIEDDEAGDPGAIIGDEAMAKHIARHDPARVLREVEARRRLIHRYERAVAASESVVAFVNGQDDGYRQACLDATRDAVEEYDGHPEYLEEWRP